MSIIFLFSAVHFDFLSSDIKQTNNNNNNKNKTNASGIIKSLANDYRTLHIRKFFRRFFSLSLFSYSGIFFKQIFFIEKLVKTNCAVCTIVPILFVYIQWFTIVTLIFIQQTSFNLLWWAENIIFIIELPIYSSPLNDSVW